MGFKEWIIPQEKIFFSFLEKESRFVLKAAELLHELTHGYSYAAKIKEVREKIKKVEHDGDEVVHEIFLRLNKSFITPIDHEDISRLASLYDDVLDFIFAVANRLQLFKLKKLDSVIKQYSEIILKLVKELDSLMRCIRKINQKEMQRKFVEIHKLENEGDMLLNKAIASLFKQRDAVKIIILKEIYENLEIITDKCEDVSNVIQDIVIKNA